MCDLNNRAEAPFVLSQTMNSLLCQNIPRTFPSRAISSLFVLGPVGCSNVQDRPLSFRSLKLAEAG